MKRIFSVCFLIGFLALLMPVRSIAQDDIADLVKEEMESYYKDLVKLDQQIVTADDAERLENRYKNQIKLVESCYSEYTEIFRYDRKLFSVYENYTDLYQQLGKRIDELKAEKARQEQLEKLGGKFDRYLEQLTGLKETGDRCVDNKKADSLKIVKQQAMEYYEEALKDYGKNGDIVDEDETLNQTWKKIKETHTYISSLEVQKSPFSMTLVLEIAGTLLALVLIINMISAKIKAAKLMKPKDPKPKKDKPKEELPSI